jgi:hypothetical protein
MTNEHHRDKEEGDMMASTTAQSGDQTTDQTPSKADQRTDQVAAGQTGSRPYGMIVALAALVLISFVASLAMVIFKDLFESATEVTTVLGSLFAVVGTVVGAYFGIKSSADTRDRMLGTIESVQGERNRANELSKRALAELDQETSRRILRDVDQSER